jgi:hypothetical protein
MRTDEAGSVSVPSLRRDLERMNTTGRCVLRYCRPAVFIAPVFLACLYIPKPTLTDAQPFSYNFPGKSQETLFTVASAVLTAQGYYIETAEKYTWTITTDAERLPLGDEDCDCATDAGIVYHNIQNTTTHVVLTLTVYPERIVIKTDVVRKFVNEDPGYGTRFYCVSKGTIESDLFRKIDSAVRSGF